MKMISYFFIWSHQIIVLSGMYMLRYIWTTIRWKPRRKTGRFLIYRSGKAKKKMAKIETFRDISRNVDIIAIWFSELRTVVIVALVCWIPCVQSFSFHSHSRTNRPCLVIWSYQILFNVLFISFGSRTPEVGQVRKGRPADPGGGGGSKKYRHPLFFS